MKTKEELGELALATARAKNVVTKKWDMYNAAQEEFDKIEASLNQATQELLDAEKARDEKWITGYKAEILSVGVVEWDDKRNNWLVTLWNFGHIDSNFMKQTREEEVFGWSVEELRLIASIYSRFGNKAAIQFANDNLLYRKLAKKEGSK